MELVNSKFFWPDEYWIFPERKYFSGVGFCAVLIAFYVSFYYNVIIGKLKIKFRLQYDQKKLFRTDTIVETSDKSSLLTFSLGALFSWN